jgi:hypothetical protein
VEEVEEQIQEPHRGNERARVRGQAGLARILKLFES